MRIKRRHPTILLPFAVACMMSAVNIAAFAQPKESQTPLQRQIEVQKNRLTSADAEERRDALMKLNLMRRPEASRAAAASLNDAEPSVRVAAAHALTSTPSGDAANALIPLLQDKLEFVRREVAMALGKIGSNSAVPALQAALHSDDPYLAEAAREALRRMHAPLK